MRIPSLFLARPVSTLLWLGAFLCSFYFVNEWQLGFFVGSVTLLFVWSWAMMAQASRGAWDVPKSAVLYFAAAFWGWIFLSVFWSEVPLVTVTGFCFFSTLPLTFFMFVLRPDDRQFRQIAIFIAALSAGLGVWAVVQYCIVYNPFGGQAHHPLGDPNSLAGFFNLSLIPAVAALMMTRRKKYVFLLLALVAALSGGIVATGSRSAIVALLPALVVLVIGTFYYARQAKGRLASAVAIFAIMLALSQAVSPMKWNSPAQRITDMVQMNEPERTASRLGLWEGVGGYIKNHWETGTGFGTFFLYYPEFRVDHKHSAVTMAHSDPLQYWAELGIMGPVLFYAFVIAAFVRTVRVLKRVPADDPRRVVIMASFSALGALVIQAHINFNFYNLCILYGAGFLLAVWFVTAQRIVPDKIVTTGFPETTGMAMRRVCLALPFIPLLYLFGSYMASEHFVNKAQHALLREQNLPKFAGNLSLAHKFDRGHNFRTWLLAANIPLGVLQDDFNQKNLSDEKKKEFYEQAMGQLERARALNPRSSSALYYLGKLQTLVPASLLAPDAPKPEDMYKEALRLDPLHLGARTGLAKIYRDEGREDEAFALLKEGFDYHYVSPAAMEYYMNMMVEFLSHGDKESYKAAMRKIAEFRARMEISAKLEKRRLGSAPVPVGREADFD